MALRQKQKLCKKKRLLKLSAINSLIYIMIFIAGSALDSTILVALLHLNRQSKITHPIFLALLFLYLIQIY